MHLVLDDWQIQIVPIAIFLIIFGACMNILFTIKVKNLLLNDHIDSLNDVDYWAQSGWQLLST